MKNKSSVAQFLYASSEQSADVFYLSGIFVPDPLLCGIIGGKSFAVVSRLEYSRVKAASKLDEVFLQETEIRKAAGALKMELKEVGPTELIRYYLKCNRLRQLQVPAEFPAVCYARLKEVGLNVEVGPSPFFCAREIKNDVEAENIRKGNVASAAGIRTARQILRASSIEGKRLKYQGRTLTSEWLRCMIDQACLAKGAVAQRTIVAGGKQSCDPHEVGYGPLQPNELIVVDVFPRIQKTGYYGDMTRTFLKGRANDSQRALVGAVREAQKAALDRVKAGVSGSSVHRAANDVFVKRGFFTERRSDHFVGFIHSTGHGLGLEVHEPPRISVCTSRLKTGQVVTIEPGLYYPEIGGCRIEDVVRVTKNGSELLSSAQYRWEIK